MNNNIDLNCDSLMFEENVLFYLAQADKLIVQVAEEF